MTRVLVTGGAGFIGSHLADKLIEKGNTVVSVDIAFPNHPNKIVKFLDQWKRGAPLTIVPDGKQRRDFTHVSDVVAANILAMESENVGEGEVINIGSGKNYSILEVADVIGGKNYPRVFISPRLGEVKETLADRLRAKILLNWEPKISLENGLETLKKQIK